jgi:hypothetical protein
MADTIVTLSRTYEAHGRTFCEVRFREPTGADLDAIGDVIEWQRTSDGAPLIIYHDDRVIAWRDRLLVNGADMPSPADLSQISLRDALAVRDAINGFFTAARRSLSAPAKTN